MTPQLHGAVIARASLSEPEVAAMYAIFEEHYAATTCEIFRRDLATKNWVVRLFDETNVLQGFSTMAIYETCALGKKMSVVYSGDTIIRPAFWGTPELPRTWIRAVLEITQTMPQPLYWLLISSGYKTYRFLPVFCKEFFPRYDRPTPPGLQLLMDELASERFGVEYFPDQGIVRFQNGASPLRAGVAEITPERLADPHIAFFAARNPGHIHGDELVCLAQIHPDNFAAPVRRLMRAI